MDPTFDKKFLVSEKKVEDRLRASNCAVVLTHHEFGSSRFINLYMCDNIVKMFIKEESQRKNLRNTEFGDHSSYTVKNDCDFNGKRL